MEDSPEQSQPAIRASDADRERVAKILHDAMAEGRLNTDELDERLVTLYAAKTLDELRPLTIDLPVDAPVPAPSSAPPADLAHRFGGTPTSSSAIAVFGGADRRGRWVVPGTFTAIAVFGGAELDLTEARFAERETTIRVTALFGGVDVRVPEDVNVRVDGIGILGGFDNKVGSQAPEGAPFVRITGLALFGGVDVKPPKRRRWGRRRGIEQ